jgi:hypothetical protein
MVTGTFGGLVSIAAAYLCVWLRYRTVQLTVCLNTLQTRDIVCGLPASTQGVGRILHAEAEAYATTAFIGAST